MAITKRIVCLANSRKLQGRCVAGRELNHYGLGPWVRPISDRPTEEVSEEERRYEDGSDPAVLDIVDIPVVAPRPKGYQQENWVLEPTLYWVKAGRFPLRDLRGTQDRVGPLWLNGSSSSTGKNDRIPLGQAAHLNSSLKLIHCETLNIRVFAPGKTFGNAKRRVQAGFAFDKTDYNLWITDPMIEGQYLAKADGHYLVSDVYMTISLGEAYQGYCYKLVATVIAAS